VQPSACAGSAQRPINLSSQLGEIVLGLSVAQKEAGRDDVSDLRLIIGGIRDRLGVIGGRYVQRANATADLARADRALAKIQDLADSDSDAVPEALDQWQSQFARLSKSLTREEARSWFNPAVLAKSL
jgi:hypothetical protein